MSHLRLATLGLVFLAGGAASGIAAEPPDVLSLVKPFVGTGGHGHTVQLLGGRAGLVAKLDTIFATPLDAEAAGLPIDVSGLIGQYAHGNGPSHHVAYLYTYAGAPWKTQEKVRGILDTMYDDTPEGLSGNEDCGQMSAWYVLSALGFMAAGELRLVLGPKPSPGWATAVADRPPSMTGAVAP